MRLWILAGLIWFWLITVSFGTVSFSLLRQDDSFPEDIESLDAPDWWKALKRNPAGSGSFSVGGEIRMYWESFDNPNWGADIDDAYLLQRYVVHGDLQLSGKWRVFGQLYSAKIGDREEAPSPVEVNDLEAQQAWLEWSSEDTQIRIGKQEFILGSQRLVGVREGPNVRRSFTGVLVSHAVSQSWDLQGFYLRPVLNRTGAFDDDWFPAGQEFWGLYATVASPGIAGALDMYVLGYRNEDARFNEGQAIEDRQTVGLRWFNRTERWDWNVESIIQVGEFGAGDIRAWTLATELGHTFAEVSGSPRLVARFNMASGDDTAGDGDLETFNPLFPRGNYFGESGLVGPSNFVDLYVGLEWSPTATLRTGIYSDWFWRESREDGVYAPPTRLVRPGNQSDARYVGHEISVTVEWFPSPFLEFLVAGSYFSTGDFLQADDQARDTVYAAASVKFLF